MKTAIITVGVSASGKTTWANQFIKENPGYYIVCRDTIRTEILAESGIKFSWKNWKWKWEPEVTRRAMAQLERYSHLNFVHGVIIADTNLDVKRLNTLAVKLIRMGYENIEIKSFPITWEEAVARDAARENGVGVSVIAEQFEKWNKEYKMSYTPIPNSTKVVMVDIDGTLAHRDMTMAKPRGFFDWSMVKTDVADCVVADIVRGMYRQDYDVIVMSGRDSICRQDTTDWLHNNNIPFNKLFMREERDNRKDTVVKEELFWKYVAPYYDVQLVIDDRPCCVRLWQTIGLKTLAAGNPWIEF